MDEQALTKISYGLFLLSVREDGRDNANIINTLSQIANKPNCVSVSVSKKSLTHAMLLRTGLFSASILTADTPFSLFQHFGMQSGREKDKFNAYLHQTERDPAGLLHLTVHSCAYVTGQVLHTLDFQSHTLFIADPIHAEILSQQPPLTYDDYYRHVKPKAEASDKTGWRCRVCWYVYEGTELPDDFICPWCKHGTVDFERV